MSGARVAFLLLAQNCQVVSMPLAFTQEDFLVILLFWKLKSAMIDQRNPVDTRFVTQIR